MQSLGKAKAPQNEAAGQRTEKEQTQEVTVLFKCY